MAKKFEVLNPATGKVISILTETEEQEVTNAVRRARDAFPTWKVTSVEERISLFEKLAGIIDENADSLIALIGEETGKRKSDAEYEVYDIIDGIGHYSRQLKVLTYQDHTVPLTFLPHGSKFNTIPEIRFEPHGVAAIIMPWNFPFWIPMANIVPALLAGNTAVFKPSEFSTLVGSRIAELFKQAGFPKGVLELVVGADEVGKVLVREDVDILFFTGGVDAGLSVLQNAGIKPVEVELGGNSASIVCEDANIDLAVEGIVWGALYNVGQSCSGHKRVYVHEAIAEDFIEKILEKVNDLKPIQDFGPYIRKSELSKVHDRIQDAVNNGAILLAGGKPIEDLLEEHADGYWYSPTVLVYTDDNIELVCKETFGNVLPIRIVESVPEAISLANNTTYGLTNILWISDLEKGNELADQIESGIVFINEAELALVAGEYWGGWKNSGKGGIGTKLEKCLKRKLVITYTKDTPREYWFPYE